MTQDIDEQRERLAALRGREKELRGLRERERELEVDCIAARAALAPMHTDGRPELMPEPAAAIADALDRSDELRAQIRALEQRLARSGNDDMDRLLRLQSAVEALRSWVEAPKEREPARSRLAIRAVLLGVTVAILWAAWVVHAAFLVLLFPLVGATSFLLWSNQDTKWRRLGAKRQFEATGIDPPPAWDDSSVRARARTLTDELEAASQAPPGVAEQESDVSAELDAASSQLEEQTERLSAALDGAGLTMKALDEDFAKWARLVAQAHRAEQDLSRVKVELKAASAELDTTREGLFRFLARHGEAPSDGAADTSELAAGLERLAARLAEPD